MVMSSMNLHWVNDLPGTLVSIKDAFERERLLRRVIARRRHTNIYIFRKALIKVNARSLKGSNTGKLTNSISPNANFGLNSLPFPLTRKKRLKYPKPRTVRISVITPSSMKRPTSEHGLHTLTVAA